MSTKQRRISSADLETLAGVPEEAKGTALWLWLHLDPLGRGLADPRILARRMRINEPLDVAADRVESHLLMLMDAGWLTTFHAEDDEWILLLHPLRVDMRDVRITTPDPPEHLGNLPLGNPLAVGGGRAGARARAREEVRAEGAARAAAWDAVQRDRERAPERPERPWALDAPPMFCDKHMPGGAGQKKCGPCGDRRRIRDEWMVTRVYEEKLAEFHEESGEVWGGEPF